MYYKKKDSTQLLMEKIMRGEVPLVTILGNEVDGRSYRYETLNEHGTVDYSKEHRVKKLGYDVTLEDLIDNKLPYQRLFINTPTDDSPYFLDLVKARDQSGVGDGMVRMMNHKYLEVITISLTSSQFNYEMDKYDKHMTELGITRAEDLAYEESLIDDTDYNKYRLLICK